MKLILKFTPTGAIPSAWCELCNTEITDAGMAMVYWRWQDEEQEFHAPLLAHKRCMSVDQARDTAYPCSIELDAYLAFLLQNVGVTGLKLTEAIKSATILSQLW